MAAKHKPNYDKDYVIILGSKIRENGTLTPILQARVDKAIEFAKEQKEKVNKNIIFVTSGGKGEDEIISEAEAMKNYLIEKGVSPEDIIVEDKSKNTFQNMKFSKKKIALTYMIIAVILKLTVEICLIVKMLAFVQMIHILMSLSIPILGITIIVAYIYRIKRLNEYKD